MITRLEEILKKEGLHPLDMFVKLIKIYTFDEDKLKKAMYKYTDFYRDLRRLYKWKGHKYK